VLILLSLLLGCPEPDLCADAAALEPSIELGTGQEAFIPLSDGDYLEPEFGPQGGSHIWGALRLQGFHPGDNALLVQNIVPVTLRLFIETEAYLVADSFEQGRPFEGSVESSEHFGEFIFVQGWPNFDEPPREATYRVDVEDVCGNTGEAELTVTVPAFEDTGFR